MSPKAVKKVLKDYVKLRKVFHNEELVATWWKKSVTRQHLPLSDLKKMYFKYMDNYPGLKNAINQAGFKTKILNKGKVVDEVEEFSISGARRELKDNFGNPPDLPPNTIDVLDDYNEFLEFVDQVKDFGKKSRRMDSETKYIYNFLKTHLHKGDEFIIETTNIFKTCGSCQREFMMLEAYLESVGKKMTLTVISDEGIEGTRQLFKKLD